MDLLTLGGVEHAPLLQQMEQQPWKSSLVKQGSEILHPQSLPDQTTDAKDDGLYLLSTIDHLIYPFFGSFRCDRSNKPYAHRPSSF
ncbi:hypothetical protein NL676_000572 [Syzygium grande]|nr:hypothetical protein NL676_000572 [Syzygium grande]